MPCEVTAGSRETPALRPKKQSGLVAGPGAPFTPSGNFCGSHEMLALRGMQAPTDVAFAARGSRPLRASDQLLSRGFVREQSRLDCLELALGERALRPQPRDFLELLDEFRR